VDQTPRRNIEDRSFEFACQIIPIAESLVRRGGTAALLGRQLAKSASSIGANLEEATGAQSKPDFIARTTVAFKEARESRYWIRLIQATIPSPPPGLEAVRLENGELVAILTAILKNAKSSRSERA
jgi:four helix bundle protein